MRYTYVFLPTFLMLLIGHSHAQTQRQPEPRPTTQPSQTNELTPEQIIQRFSAKETEFYEAWIQYTYKRTANISILSVNGEARNDTVTIISEVVFNDDGTREVKTLQRSGRLRSVMFTHEDQDIFDNINPFALTVKDLPLYHLNYEKKQKVDELDCHVFSVTPKSIKKGRFYFSGRIWVDDRDLQVVKTIGKAVPQTSEKQFPDFETIRQVIDGKYWFPVWSHADGKLDFSGQIVRIEETITYSDYKRFGSEAKVLFPNPNSSDKQK